MLTSISEGFPYVVIEAMASGLPVVATDVGGVAEAVGEAGVLVPPRDSAAVAAACVRLLAHPDERRALGAAARALFWKSSRQATVLAPTGLSTRNCAGANPTLSR